MPKALWATQGGGLAEWNGETYIFVESPDWWPNAVGEEVPSEWGVIPANETARNEMLESEGLY